MFGKVGVVGHYSYPVRVLFGKYGIILTPCGKSSIILSKSETFRRPGRRALAPMRHGAITELWDFASSLRQSLLDSIAFPFFCTDLNPLQPPPLPPLYLPIYTPFPSIFHNRIDFSRPRSSDLRTNGHGPRSLRPFHWGRRPECLVSRKA